MKTKPAIVLLLSLLSPLPAFGQAARPAATSKSPAQILSESGPMVALIVSSDENSTDLGSGFLVGDGSLLVTNFHVIKGAKKVLIKLADGRVLDTRTVVSFDRQKDLAILKLDRSGPQGLQLGDSDAVQVGEPVVVIGNPEGLEHTVSNGLISGVRSLQQWPRILQISAPISPGSSGGPVFNERGQVIGVVCFYLEGDQNLNFAIPINEVKDLITRSAKAPPAFLPISGNEPESSQGASPDAIELGNVELRLGMPRDWVLSELSRSADVKPLDRNRDSWMVFGRNGQPDSSSNFLGDVAFQGGVLSEVWGDWGPDDRLKGVEFARALFAVISQFEKQGHTTCEISTRERGNPGAESSDAIISCGGKSILIIISGTSESGAIASVEVGLQKPK
jgi:hypothetical protein